MTTFVLLLVLFFAINTGHSSAMYCICKDGVSDQQLQKNIDYACGNGADCTAILQNGPCFNPNTIKDHCNYAVNSYFQRKGAAGASCDFSGTATTSPNPPTTTSSGCFQSTPGSTGGGIVPGGGTTTPTVAPPGTTVPTIAPPGTTIPTTAPPGTTTPGTGIGGTGTGTGTNTGTGIGGATTPGANNPVFGLGPSGNGIANTDGNAAHLQNSIFFTIAILAISLVYA